MREPADHSLVPLQPPVRPALEELLLGPTADPSGERNLFGAVRRVMGKCGYSTLKEFQKAELIVTRGR